MTRSSGSAARLVLRRIGKSFAGGTVALSGVDLEVRDGDFPSLLGPSGCGKSTVLRLVADLAEPSEGRIDCPPADSGRATWASCSGRRR